MEIDVNLLHDVIEGRRYGRGTGQTFATVMVAVQSADVQSFTQSGRFALVVGLNQQSWAINLAVDIAKAMNIQIQRANRDVVRFLDGNYTTELEVICRSEISRSMRGKLYLNYFVDPYLQVQLTPPEIAFLESRIERK
jgi:hypothetical protein